MWRARATLAVLCVALGAQVAWAQERSSSAGRVEVGAFPGGGVLFTEFELLYGTSGALAEIPVHAVYQPRWWLQVELFLDEADQS